jgi:hypothetical protein
MAQKHRKKNIPKLGYFGFKHFFPSCYMYVFFWMPDGVLKRAKPFTRNERIFVRDLKLAKNVK